MDQIEDVSAELQTVKGENAIVVKLKDGLKESKLILTNQVELYESAEDASLNCFLL